jgi:hypothetical protein
VKPSGLALSTAEPTLEVRITTHWRKSAVRPWRSVSRPSSNCCRKTFQMLWWAF